MQLTEAKVGVVLSGGQAPGGHNAISGLFDFLKGRNPNSRLFGFLGMEALLHPNSGVSNAFFMNFPAGGPIGVVNGDFTEITEDLLAPYRNQGGFDIIGTGRDKVLAER
jgi:pyrophosphate--fructose-6-phosphate 1-phosphotransferase